MQRKCPAPPETISGQRTWPMLQGFLVRPCPIHYVVRSTEYGVVASELVNCYLLLRLIGDCVETVAWLWKSLRGFLAILWLQSAESKEGDKEYARFWFGLAPPWMTGRMKDYCIDAERRYTFLYYVQYKIGTSQSKVSGAGGTGQARRLRRLWDHALIMSFTCPCSMKLNKHSSGRISTRISWNYMAN